MTKLSVVSEAECRREEKYSLLKLVAVIGIIVILLLLVHCKINC